MKAHQLAQPWCCDTRRRVLHHCLSVTALATLHAGRNDVHVR
jgi:hypothetical protein